MTDADLEMGRTSGIANEALDAMTPAQAARAVRKAKAAAGRAGTRMLNRAQNAREHLAAQVRRSAAKAVAERGSRTMGAAFT